jgi:4-hydroxybenzoate polyprenyltransferase
MNHYTKLVRLGQWYKNSLIFLPLLFATSDQLYSWPLLILGFFGFSAVSSITYMINDWIDREADRMHPTKKHRPLASGKISGKVAIGVAVLMSAIVGVAIWKLGLFYGATVGTYFVATNLYSFGLKNIPLIDMALIAGNFTLRTLAGVTEWPDLSSAPYFLLIFSVIFIFLTHKRRSDNKLLGKKAAAHKPVLRFYTKRNAYVVRAIGYLGVLYGLSLLLGQGASVIHLGPPFGLLMVTSFLFSEDPKLTLNPQGLFKEWAWDVAFAITVLSWII